MSARVVAVVQARLGSSRLPCKSLLALRGLPVIDWIWQRLNRSERLAEIVFAIPDTTLDRVLGEHLRRLGARHICGSEQDVLGRMATAARSARADLAVRVCADNPLVWGLAIDRLVDFYSRSELDYAWNHIPRDNMWPDGLGAEIVSADLLYELERVAELPAQREHCFNYIWDNAGRFRMGTFDPDEDWLKRPDIRLDIDSVADFERLSLLPLDPGMDAAAIIAAWNAGCQSLCNAPV